MSDGTLLAVSSNISFDDDTYLPPATVDRPTSPFVPLTLSRRFSAPIHPTSRIPIPGDTYIPHLCPAPHAPRNIAAALSGANFHAIWTIDLDTATPVIRFAELQEQISCLVPGPDDAGMACSSKDGSLRLWDHRVPEGVMTSEVWAVSAPPLSETMMR